MSTNHVTVTGEIFELKAELNNEKKEKRKEAVKKVIAAMTVGKDVRCFDSFITITESDMRYYFPHFLKDDYFDPNSYTNTFLYLVSLVPCFQMW